MVAGIKIVELVGQNFAVEQTTAATDAPDGTSATLIRLRAGVVVKVVGIVEGDSWLQIELPDERIGYVPISAIPSAIGPPAPDEAAKDASAVASHTAVEPPKVTMTEDTPGIESGAVAEPCKDTSAIKDGAAALDVAVEPRNVKATNIDAFVHESDRTVDPSKVAITHEGPPPFEPDAVVEPGRVTAASPTLAKPQVNQQTLIALVTVTLVAIAVGVWMLRPRFHAAAPTVAQIKIAELVEQNFAVEQPTAVTEAPDGGSALLIRLRAGIVVKVVGIVEGDSWLQVELPDNRIGYVPLSAIPTVKGPGAPEETAKNASAVGFDATLERWKVATSSTVFSAPDDHSRQLYPVEAGRLVDVIAKSKDGKWAWVRTTDDSPAFLQVASLTFIEAAKPSPASPVAASQPALDLPDEVAGRAQAITTSMIMVDGRKIALAGLRGQGGDYRDHFQALIDSLGGTLTCRRQGRQYTCQFPDGNDAGRAVLYNGGARPAAGASDDYREQAKSAQDAHRGVWQ